ncbi:uncharacterized protein PG986_003382 [Apiospora aurea]|uniref:Uncharacterized protein n=1 Tax=Apiospora aurea TaxID=335848 RepID=A0ABR1QRI8_9PEZI
MNTSPSQPECQANRKRPRQEDDVNARHVKRRKVCRVQVAKKLIRSRSMITPPTTNSEGSTSSDHSEAKSRKTERKQGKAPTQVDEESSSSSSSQCQLPISPPPSPKIRPLLDFQYPVHDITPASLRDYMMSGSYRDCFLGEEVNNIILKEYKAAESQQPKTTCNETTG